MPTPRGNPDQYLQKIGGTYYARVRVPRTLETLVRQTHLRRSLKTGDRAEANRRKHAVVGELKNQLEKLRKPPGEAAGSGMSFADAKGWRDGFKELEAARDDYNFQEMALLATSKAEEIEALFGIERAKRWYRAATVTTETLSELMTKFLNDSDFRESTKHRHKKALEDFLNYLKDLEAHPQDVTRKVTIKYLDEELTQRGLAHTTIRDRLVSLGSFWKWMSSRSVVPEDTNPWGNHKLSKVKNKGSAPPKRSYSDDEILALLEGTEETVKWPTYGYLPDLIVLGMFTGCRVEELCCLHLKHIEKEKGHYIIQVTDAKTKAGIRPVAVTHPAPMAILKRRMDTQADRLFPELTPGGLDSKYSNSAVKAYGRYRRACGVPDGTDYHSFRRNVITLLERAKVGQVEIARFVGHKIRTMAGDTYSGGGDVKRSLEVSRSLKYSKNVEKAVSALALMSDQ